MRQSNRALLDKIAKREAFIERTKNATPKITVCPDVDMVKSICLPYYDGIAFELCECSASLEGILSEIEQKIASPYTYLPTVGDPKERMRSTRTPVECESCHRAFIPESYRRLNGMVKKQQYCSRCHNVSVRNGIRKYGSYEAYIAVRDLILKKRKLIPLEKLKHYVGVKGNKSMLQEQMSLYNELYDSGYERLEDFQKDILTPGKKVKKIQKPKQTKEEIEIWGRDLTREEVMEKMDDQNKEEQQTEETKKALIPVQNSVQPTKKVCSIDNEQAFKSAIEEIRENRITFLTGKAGTGKTTFLKAVKEKYDNVVVVAPTGIAALNAGGVTIHSFFQIGFRPYMPNDEDLLPQNIARRFKYIKAKQEIIRNMNLLIIDEVSMVKSYTIDVIDKLLRYYRQNSTEPFGGVQVLLIGDLLQLPPVVNSNDGEREIIDHFYDSAFFFDAKVIQESGLSYRELTKVYRQSDGHFIDLLGRIRLGKQTQFDLDRLNRRLTNEIKEGFITLTNTKRKSQAINEEKLNEIEYPSFYFDAEIEGEFAPSEYPTQKRLELKVGAQVMILKNRANYVNGMIGIIEGISKNVVKVRVDETVHNVVIDTWQKIKYSMVNGRIEEKVIGEFTQMPLTLAWAINIHKSQGLTFDKVRVDCAGAFAEGQTYVALSRCRSLDGLELASKISWSDIKVSHTVTRFLSQFIDLEEDLKKTDQDPLICNEPCDVQENEQDPSDEMDLPVLEALYFDTKCGSGEIDEVVVEETSWRDAFFDDLCSGHKRVQELLETYRYELADILDSNMDRSCLDHYHFQKVLCSLYSIKTGRVHGFGFSNILEVANNYLEYYREFSDIFLRALKVFNREAELFAMDRSGAFTRKYNKVLREPQPQQSSMDFFIAYLLDADELYTVEVAETVVEVQNEIYDETEIDDYVKEEPQNEIEIQDMVIEIPSFPDKIQVPMPKESKAPIEKERSDNDKSDMNAKPEAEEIGFFEAMLYLIFQLPFEIIVWAFGYVVEEKEERGFFRSMMHKIKKAVAYIIVIVVIGVLVVLAFK